jgi:hypothetical protein
MADSSTRKLINYLTRKLKSFLFSRDVLSFLVFLVLSAAFWFVNALNKEREMTLELPVKYTGFPENILLTDQLPKSIELKIKDLGLNLWNYYSSKPDSVNINFNGSFKESGMISVPNTRIYAAVVEKLLPTTAILELRPESLVSGYVKLHAKKVPVELITEISLENQYMFCSEVKPIPEFVEIYGSSDDLAEINSVQTEILKVKDLKDSLKSEVALHKIKNVRFAVSKVFVQLCAEMFTEKVISLPVQLINSPSGFNVKAFPAEVKATFNIGISHFIEFKNDDIQVILDFNDISYVSNSKKKLTVINRKSYINNIRIQPEEVEFLLENKR